MSTRRAPLLASGLLLCLILCPMAASAPDSDVALLRSGQAFVPLRAIFEWLGAAVDYRDGEVSARRGTETVTLTLGQTGAWVNGTKMVLPQAPFIAGSKAYVPLRFVADSFGAKVDYDAKARTVTVARDGRSMSLNVQPAPAQTRQTSAPLDVAFAVFRAFLGSEYPEQFGKRRCAFIEAGANLWMKADYPYEMYAGTDEGHARSGLERDPRFATAIRKAGGKVGDDWLPYRVERPSHTKVHVEFLAWNWGWWLDVVSVGEQWTVRAVEADGEGNEDNPPMHWDVSGGGGAWTFRRR